LALSKLGSFSVDGTLENLGFRSISADTIGVAEEASQLTFLPSTCGLPDLQAAVRQARTTSDIQPVIVVLFHAYDFLESDRRNGKLTYQDFVELLKWVTSQEDIHERTIGETTQVIRDLDSHRFMSYSSFLSSPHPLSPLFLNELLFNKLFIYPSSGLVRCMKVKLWLFLTLLYLGAFVTSITATFLIGCVVFSRHRVLGSAAKYGGLLFLGSFSVYALHDLDIYFRAAIALTCLCGMCIGTWGSLRKLKKVAQK